MLMLETLPISFSTCFHWGISQDLVLPQGQQYSIFYPQCAVMVWVNLKVESPKPLYGRAKSHHHADQQTRWRPQKRFMTLAVGVSTLHSSENIFVLSLWCRRAEFTAVYCKRSAGPIYWPGGVITLTGSLSAALFSLCSIYKCHSGSNPTVSPLSLERAAAIRRHRLITYSSNEE